MTAPAATGVLAGFGPLGYHIAIISMIEIFNQIKAAKAARKTQQA